MFHHIKTILVLSVKELKLLLGEPLIMIFILWAFTLANVGTYELLQTSGVVNARVGVQDNDRTELSREIVSGVLQPYFNLDPRNLDSREADKGMEHRQYSFIINIPEGFEKDVLAGGDRKIQLVADASQLSIAGIGAGYLSVIVNKAISDYLYKKTSGAGGPTLPVDERIYSNYDPKLSISNFYVVAQASLSVFLIVLLLVGAAVIREKEKGTLEHLLVMPVNAFDVLFSKILSMGLVSVLGYMTMMYWVNGYILDIPILGSFWNLLLGTVLFLFSAASVAVLLAIIAPNLPLFVLVGILVISLSNLMTGGMTPLENMPEFMQTMVQIAPNTMFIRSSIAIVMKGATLSEVWWDYVLLAANGVVLMLIAMNRFQKMLERAV